MTAMQTASLDSHGATRPVVPYARAAVQGVGLRCFGHLAAVVHKRAETGGGRLRLQCSLLPSPFPPFTVCACSRGVSVGAPHHEALALAERRWRDER